MLQLKMKKILLLNTTKYVLHVICCFFSYHPKIQFRYKFLNVHGLSSKELTLSRNHFVEIIYFCKIKLQGSCLFTPSLTVDLGLFGRWVIFLSKEHLFCDVLSMVVTNRQVVGKSPLRAHSGLSLDSLRAHPHKKQQRAETLLTVFIRLCQCFQLSCKLPLSCLSVFCLPHWVWFFQ